MRQAEVKSLNRWFVVGGAVFSLGGTGILALLGWMALSIGALTVDVVAIRTELDLVKPADVLRAVHEIDTRLQSLEVASRE